MPHEFDGKQYEQAATHQREWGQRLIDELGLRGAERVLDLGCGDGTITARIADLVPDGHVLGIDASQGMIDAARPRQRGNLEFVLMDIDELGFVDEFDVVFSNATLHWVKDHLRLLVNLERALRPGGVARLNFAADGNCSHLLAIVREAMALDSFARHFARFEWPWYMPTIDEYEHLVSQSGLCRARVWGENADRAFPNVEAMIKWIDQPSLVPFLAHLPERCRPEFRDFVVGRMIDETRQEDGTCFETFRRMNVLAHKQTTASSP